MDAERFQRANEIFDKLVDAPRPQRSAVLDGCCEHDAALRAFVENLLACHDRGIGGFLAQPALDTTVNLPLSDEGAAATERVPTRIGRYEIVRLIAEGGMGTVYEARQDRPNRRVALKVIRQGFASSTMLRRFQYEAEVLGRLQHPGIAQIFEAGVAEVSGEWLVVSETGAPTASKAQPFFAMEFVEGPPLTDYAREHQLDVRQRLQLMVRVCDAVQHAHQQGVIHRDLKPANILVAQGDQAGLRTQDSGLSKGRTADKPHSVLSPQSSALPKILDFGISRTTDADLRTVTFGTSAGQLIGTLAYMSPEQVSGDPAQLDTRSDVYSLGVILYELLAGKLPHDVTTCSIAEAARRIRDEEPARLTATQRSLGGDLEVLVAKALAKDKSRRYRSAAALGDDLRHYLTGEPIEARRDSRWYLVRKTVARHRGAAAAGTAFVVLLAASTVALAIMYGGQVRERERATAAATEAQVERKRALEAAAQAEAERERATAAATRAQAVSTFLETMLTSVDPAYSADAEVTVRQVVDQAVKDLDSGSLREQPELEAELMRTLGQTYIGLGVYPEAEALLTGALDRQRRLSEPGSLALADAVHELAVLRHHQGRNAEAASMLEEVLSVRRTLLGPEHLGVATALHNLAAVHAEERDPAKAEPFAREALAIRRAVLAPHHPDVLDSINSQAVLLSRLGKAADAEALYREILATDRSAMGDRLLPLTHAMNNLGFMLQSRGDYTEAEQLYRESLAICRKVLGEGHPELGRSFNNLAALLRDMGDLAAAGPLAREGLEIRHKSLPPDHPDIARSALLLGMILLEQGNGREAELPLRECWEIRKKAMPAGHYLTAEAASVLGESLTMLGRYDEAEPLLVESYPVIKAQRGEHHPRTLDAVRRMRDFYKATGQPEKAAAFEPRSNATDVASQPPAMAGAPDSPPP